MKSKIVVISILMVFMFIGVSSAGTYFRANAGGPVSSNQELSLSKYGMTQEFDLDEDGRLGINGALGYKPGAHTQSNFFGEIESGYSRGDADFTVSGVRARYLGESEDYQVETIMEFVHVFFNFGYEYVTKVGVVDGDPLKVSLFAGAGPVFSEIHADVSGVRDGELQLDNLEGDTSLGYQFGGNLWLPVVPGVEVGGGVKYVNRGEHRTIPGIKYENDSIDATAGVRIWF